MLEKLRSIAIWTAIAAVSLITFTLAVCTTSVSLIWDFRKRAFAHKWPRFWANGVVRVNPAWSVFVDDSRMPRNRHFVIVCNHESTGDIIINLHLKHHFKFVAKASIYAIPLVGWFMYFAGYIKLRRDSKRSIVECMHKARMWLDRGVSVLFYPEGTRSEDGQMRPFKLGAFRLAVQAKVDVLPVLISGAADLLPKNTFVFSRKKTPMRLIVCDPISVAGLTIEDVPSLAERAREAILEMKRQDTGVAPLRAAS